MSYLQTQSYLGFGFQRINLGKGDNSVLAHFNPVSRSNSKIRPVLPLLIVTSEYEGGGPMSCVWFHTYDTSYGKAPKLCRASSLHGYFIWAFGRPFRCSVQEMLLVVGPVVEAVNPQAWATAVLTVLQNEVCFYFCFVMKAVMCIYHGNCKIIL